MAGIFFVGVLRDKAKRLDLSGGNTKEEADELRFPDSEEVHCYS